MEEAISNRRNAFNQLGKLYFAADQVQIEHVTIEDVSCYWFTPPLLETETVIVYLHGGAFVVGGIDSHRAIVSHFAAAFKAKILFLEYALAPEQPFPAGVNDLLKVYAHLTSKVVLIGDSAGCGIILPAIAALIGKQPDGVIMLSPWINLACDNPSYELNAASDPILSRGYLFDSALLYTGPNMELANPDNITFREFPPVLAFVGSGEVLLDDSRNFIEEIKEVQEHAILSVYAGQNHVWPLSDISSDAAVGLIAEMKKFIFSY
jgi:monoterpene epsilon-lactone hydrolase